MPTDQDIAELLSFLPKLTVDGFRPIRRWTGGRRIDEKTFVMSWPEYDEVVEEFVKVASRDCWCDYDYVPADAGRMLYDPETVGTATLAQLKTMLTYCIRGERFCDGHWGEMIEEGHVERLLRRVAEIRGGSF
jgi:hypothetical protein